MRLLLDTHVWIWALSTPDKLNSDVAAALTDKANELWLSPISVWEFLTLVRKGRLSLVGDPYDWLREAAKAAPMKDAPLTSEIAVLSQRLELPHWDPADRFIAATAQHLGLRLVTADQRLIGAEGLDVLSAG